MQRFVCLRNGFHLRMGRGALQFLTPVAAPADDLAVFDDDAADGDLPLLRRLARQRERLAHIGFVFHRFISPV